MIDKIRKGNRVAGLLYYLYGPGKSDEHRDPHLVAGFRMPDSIEPPFRADGKRDFRDLVNLLEAPLHLADRLGGKDSVWQCVLSAAPEDPLLSDEQWNVIATSFMDKMGLASGDDPAGVRWVAVRHGLSKEGRDHVHIVATLAGQDGGRPNMHNDYLRARKAAREIEKDFGLRVTAPADCTAVPRPGRAESEQAHRTGRAEPPRVSLRNIVQQAAATAFSEDDFLARIRQSGALVRTRNSADQPGTATGYAVALPADVAGTSKPIWFGGGRLAPDLTLPKLRRRWENTASARTAADGLDPRSARAFLRSAACSAAERARNEAGFFKLLDDEGVLVRFRYSEINPGEVTGYSLTLPGHEDGNGNLAWYGGGRLGEQLTLPRLRRRWDSDEANDRMPAALSPAERKAVWSDVIRLTGDGAAELRRLATTDPTAAADAAWATADALRAGAAALGGAPGRQIAYAARSFDRAARQTYRAVPRPTPVGDGLRTVSRMLGILRGTGSHGIRLDQFIVTLIQLAEDAARLRSVQTRAHQAVAARKASEQLLALRRDQVWVQDQARRAAAARVPACWTPSAAKSHAARVAQADIPATIRLRPPAPSEKKETEETAPQPAHPPVSPATRSRKHESRAP